MHHNTHSNIVACHVKWRTWVTDAVLIVLAAAASGHTNVTWRFMLDNCPAVSDVSLSVLLPRLPKMHEW